MKRQTRSQKAVEIALRLLDRVVATEGKPLTFNDAVTFAQQVGADEEDALLAVERLVQFGALRREFLDLKTDPPTLMSWEEVLARLGGREAIASEGWREGARTIVVRWILGEGKC
jgi:hypothetical protein